MEDSDDIISDMLFVGLTRPATMWGVPYSAFMVNIMFAAIAFLAANNFFFLLLSVPAHFILYLITYSDPHAIDNIYMWAKTNGKCMNRKFWGAATFSPLTVKKWQK